MPASSHRLMVRGERSNFAASFLVVRKDRTAAGGPEVPSDINPPGRSDLLRERNGQPAGATAQIQYRHARSDVQALDDGRRTIGLRKWIVQSTSQLKDAGQGTDRARDASRHRMATRAMAPRRPRRMYAIVPIKLCLKR